METQQIFEILDRRKGAELRKGQVSVEELERLVRELDSSIDRKYAGLLVKKWLADRFGESERLARTR